jgi:amino-acid N-acetyltransferase
VAAGNKGAVQPSAGEITLESARPDDAQDIAALLRAAGLPHEDFAAHLTNFLVAREAGTVVGAIGYERHGADALLRSLVVAPGQRSRGLGDRLVRELAARARAAGVRRFFLLTTTAERFFAARGFTRIERAAVPPAVAATEEFRSLCPASAACMTRSVGA